MLYVEVTVAGQQGPPLNPAALQAVGVMLSTVDFNMAVNTNAALGAFEFQVERVEAYTVWWCYLLQHVEHALTVCMRAVELHVPHGCAQGMFWDVMAAVCTCPHPA